MALPSRGVTLLDVLVTLAVGAILLAVGAPSFRHTIGGGERAAAVNGLLTALHRARRSALTRAQPVVLCKASADDDCVRGADLGWSEGLLAFVNTDEDDPPRRDPDELVIYRGTLPEAVAVTANREAFVMRPYGKRSTNGTFTVCDRRGSAYARAIIVSWTGRPRVADTLADGEELTCSSS
ncbi:MAG: GspH/FimT family pseudopilin [Pseudomonadota bacterium]